MRAMLVRERALQLSPVAVCQRTLSDGVARMETALVVLGIWLLASIIVAPLAVALLRRAR